MKFILSLCLLAIMASQVSTLTFSAFNIQILGLSKMSKTHVVNVLLQILDRYDVTLIQEIRDSSGTAIVNLLTQLNSYSSQSYGMELGPRLGRTSSKEQYAFFYRNDSGIQVLSSYTYDDGNETLGNDTYEREPIVTQFLLPNTVIGQLTVVGCHVKPSDVVNEMNNFTDVLVDVQNKLGTTDVLLMGDFNAGCSYLSNAQMAALNLRAPGYDWLISDNDDTTIAASSCPYDRFISTSSTLTNAIVNGNATVFYFDTFYGLNSTAAADVSDHYPIVVEFKTLPSGASGVKSSALLLAAVFTCFLLY